MTKRLRKTDTQEQRAVLLHNMMKSNIFTYDQARDSTSMEYAVVITLVERKSVTNQYEIECELRVFANLSLPFFHRGI